MALIQVDYPEFSEKTCPTCPLPAAKPHFRVERKKPSLVAGPPLQHSRAIEGLTMNPNRKIYDIVPMELVLLVAGFGVSGALFLAAWLY
jgi:hypothetical protein